jgi:hypothetical protein
VHSVFRDLENDFGADLLGSHYESADAGHGHDPVRNGQSLKP